MDNNIHQFDNRPFIRRIVKDVIEDSDCSEVCEYIKDGVFIKQLHGGSFDLFKDKYTDFLNLIDLCSSVSFTYLKHYESLDIDIMQVSFEARVNE